MKQKQLLQQRRTSYRRNQVTKLQIMMTSVVEKESVQYQENLMSTRDTDTIFKHLKILNKSKSLPNVIIKDGKCALNL